MLYCLSYIPSCSTHLSYIPLKLVSYMSERGPAAHGGLHAVLEVRCRRPASDGLSEGRVPSSGHRGVDRQDNKNQPKKRKKKVLRLTKELLLSFAIEVVYLPNG